MKLKSLTLSGFRGFASEASFNLDSGAIVVVGPNGLGKTSLLDGVLWGLCGVLGRIGDDGHIVSKYSKTGLASVRLVLRDEEEKEWTIQRTTNGKEQSVTLRIGNEEFKGASATARIVEKAWPDALISKDVAEAMANAVTRSSYLQQDLIREFVESADDHERFKAFCELVGTGRLNELQVQLDSQGRSWSNATSKLTKDLQPLKERVDTLDDQLKSLQRTATASPLADDVDWDAWWNSELLAGRADGERPSPSDIDAATKLARALTYLTGVRENARRKKTNCESLLAFLGTRPSASQVALAELEMDLSSAKVDLDSKTQRVNDARQKAALEREFQLKATELAEQNRALAAIALKLLSDKCPVCNQRYDFDETRTRLEKLISDVPNPQHAVPVNIDTLVKEEREATTRFNDLTRKLSDAKKQTEAVATWTSEVATRLRELGLNTGEDIRATLINSINELTTIDGDLTKQIDRGEKLSLNFARASAGARVVSVTTDLDDAKKQFAKQSTEIKRREKTYDIIRLLIEAMRTANDRLALDRLKEIEPFAQRIYSRIDPHPTFRILRFATELFRGKGQFITTLVDEEDDVAVDRPSALLSSSQLNALAVAIFLSFNLTLPRLPIECAILDDPLKSLDDINMLGVVDLLRRVKQNRQLIVTTHDARLGKLLARKLRPVERGQTTSVIQFFEWTKQGPTFAQECVEPDQHEFQFARTG